MSTMPDSLWTPDLHANLTTGSRMTGLAGASNGPGADTMFDQNGELVWINGHAGEALITIAVPTYRDDASRMIRALSRCDGAEATELVIYDDGSGNPPMRERMRDALRDYPGPGKLVAARENLGRSHARNRLIAHGGTRWLLLLDADMLPDRNAFLRIYLAAARACESPALFAGGFSLEQVRPRRNQKLHAAQSRRSECLDAETRARQPGRHVFTSNLLVHRDILQAIAFDDAYVGWGWEDVDWGLRVAEQFQVCHIDNTASHLGLDRDRDLMRKYRRSGPNFARLVRRHPEAARQMSLYKSARLLKWLGPLNWPLAWIAGAVARLAILPAALRLAGLKLYRAAHYARSV